MPISPRKARQRALAALRRRAPRRVEPHLELLERELERAEPARLQQLDHELVLAALRVDLDGCRTA